MKRFIREEIRTFLRALDKHAPRNSRLVIIGGAAATLAYGATGGTTDLDTANSVSSLEKACSAAQEETGLEIPLGMSPVMEAPYEYESRLRKVTFRGFKMLTIFVPEKHDWALMKMARLLDKDIEHVKVVSQKVGFNSGTFLTRFLSEMTHIEPRKRLIQDFLAMMEELYGEASADRMEKAIRNHKHWQ